MPAQSPPGRRLDNEHGRSAVQHARQESARVLHRIRDTRKWTARAKSRSRLAKPNRHGRRFCPPYGPRFPPAGGALLREKELRIALVCFGGVSLAIYMHGISKEILKLIRASSKLHAIADRAWRAKAS